MSDPSLTTLGLLALAGLLAGWIDAVVGGGGLVQLPAILLGVPGASPVQVLGTNKMASICGTLTSSVTYWRRVRPDLRTAAPLALAAFGGSMLGALAASHIPKAAFTPIILVVLVAVGAYTLRRPDLGQVEALRHAGRCHYGTAAAIGALIGFYDGALGPGTGSFLVICLVSVLGYGFLQASAKAKIANAATNLAALVVFIPQGGVMWRVALVMGVANILGGYLGARTAVARGSAFVRIVFIVVVGAFVLRLSWQLLRAYS